jgi:hypothetical protein
MSTNYHYLMFPWKVLWWFDNTWVWNVYILNLLAVKELLLFSVASTKTDDISFYHPQWNYKEVVVVYILLNLFSAWTLNNNQSSKHCGRWGHKITIARTNASYMYGQPYLRNKQQMFLFFTCECIRFSLIQMSTSNLAHTTCFWNSLYQVRSKTNYWKAT